MYRPHSPTINQTFALVNRDRRKYRIHGTAATLLLKKSQAYVITTHNMGSIDGSYSLKPQALVLQGNRHNLLAPLLNGLLYRPWRWRRSHLYRTNCLLCADPPVGFYTSRDKPGCFLKVTLDVLFVANIFIQPTETLECKGCALGRQHQAQVVLTLLQRLYLTACAKTLKLTRVIP